MGGTGATVILLTTERRDMNLHFDQVKKVAFESFCEESFRVLLDSLSIQGYVFDFIEVDGVTFTTKQIEYLDQEMFQVLCNKFANTCTEFSVSSTGDYFEGNGNMYIAYNKKMYSYYDAIALLNKKVMSIKK